MPSILATILILGGCTTLSNNLLRYQDITNPRKKIELKNKIKTAILLIDMQDQYLGEENVNIPEVKRMIKRQTEIIKYAQSNNIPIYSLEGGVMWTDDEDCKVYESFGQTTESLQNVLDKGNYDLVIKGSPSGFGGTELDSFLKERGISDLVLMGVYASDCILATGKDAIQRGYKIITSPEIIEDNKHRKMQNESMDWYKENGLVFDDYSDIIHYLKKN